MDRNAMSIVMDGQDVCGYLRGVCIVAIVGKYGPTVTHPKIAQWINVDMSATLPSFVERLASYSGLEAAVLTAAVEELLAAGDAFVATENLEMQLGIFAGRPVPEFPFLRNGAVDRVTLRLPFLEAAKKLVHAAVRVRMQSGVTSKTEPFWQAAVTLVQAVGQYDPLAPALARAAVADTIADVVFGNWDAPKRTDDADLARQIQVVIDELRSTDVARLS